MCISAIRGSGNHPRTIEGGPSTAWLEAGRSRRAKRCQLANGGRIRVGRTPPYSGDPRRSPARSAGGGDRLPPRGSHGRAWGSDCQTEDPAVTGQHLCAWCGRPFRARRGGLPQRFCGPPHRVAFFSAARAWALKLVESGLITAETLRASARNVHVTAGPIQAAPTLGDTALGGPGCDFK